MKSNEERLQELFDKLESQHHINSEDIPNIDLYMDQVTTFMDKHLGDTRRYQEDKILTKTMINNYAKNNLLPPPLKKKYTKNHMLVLIFVYYFKNLLSFHDIEQLIRPISEYFFDDSATVSLQSLYDEVFSLEPEQLDRLKEDVTAKFKAAGNSFQNAEDKEREYLQLFAFICELAFDVYLKKQMIETLVDQLREEMPPKKK